MINVPWLEREETAVRVKACKEAFNLASEWVVKKLIQDGDSNEESGSGASIPALKGMGVAGGSKYCVLGIFFKFSQDTKGCLYGDDIEAAKAALADMRHAAHILRTLSLTEGKGSGTSSSKAAAPASATAPNADHQDQDDDSNRSPLDDLSLLYDGPDDFKEDDDDESGDSAYDGPGDFVEMDVGLLTLTTMDSYEPEGSLYYGGLEADDADTVATAAAAEQVVVNVTSGGTRSGSSTDRGGTDSCTEEESESELVRLHFPLVTLLRLCGRVVLAVAQLPISQHTMVAGSGDAGRTVAVPPTTKLQNSLEQMCRALGIIPHLAGSSKTTQAKVYGPVDMEIHYGHDARHYILDLHRMMPCEAPLQNVSAMLLTATAGRDIDGSRRGDTNTQLVPVPLRARGAELRQIVRRVRVCFGSGLLCSCFIPRMPFCAHTLTDIPCLCSPSFWSLCSYSGTERRRRRGGGGGVYREHSGQSLRGRGGNDEYLQRSRHRHGAGSRGYAVLFRSCRCLGIERTSRTVVTE
jgi:hypothetical protein